MPMHDWTRVEPAIFQSFHHAWVSEIKREISRTLLPTDMYVMLERQAAGFGPDVLTLPTQPPT